MPIGTGLAIGLAAASAAGSVGSAALGAHAAGNAADAQANAANSAAQLQHDSAQQALDFQKQVFGQQQANLAPWLNMGESGLANLGNLLGILPQGGQSTPQGAPGQGAQQQQALAKNPQYGPEKMNIGGKWFEWDSTLSHQNGYDVYRPYSANPQQAQDQSQWVAVKNGVKTPYSQTAGAQPGSNTQATGPNGGASLQSLVNPSLGASGSLLTPWTEQFQAPTNITEQNDPGFQARLQMGTDALQKSAAAKGGLLTGGTARDLNQFSQDYASNEYGNVYNRAFGQYATRYNQFKQNQTDIYNRLANMAGMGQTSASQLNANMGQAANNYSNTLMSSANMIGNNMNNAGAARASGYVGGANAWGGALGSLGNLGTLAMLLKGGSGTGGGGGIPSGGYPVDYGSLGL